jgi:hypothetical protein
MDAVKPDALGRNPKLVGFGWKPGSLGSTDPTILPVTTWRQGCPILGINHV